jgi:hypothetical protein
MIAPDETVTNNLGVTTPSIAYNIRYKSRFEFSQPISNKAQVFTHFVQSEGLPFVSRQEYSSDGGGYLIGRLAADQSPIAGSGATYQTYAQDVMLGGRFFLLGTRLTNGRVGNDGVELHLTATMPDDLRDNGGADVGTTRYVVRTYLEYVRRARLADGEMQIFNA